MLFKNNVFIIIVCSILITIALILCYNWCSRENTITIVCTTVLVEYVSNYIAVSNIIAVPNRHWRSNQKYYNHSRRIYRQEITGFSCQDGICGYSDRLSGIWPHFDMYPCLRLFRGFVAMAIQQKLDRWHNW